MIDVPMLFVAGGHGHDVYLVRGGAAKHVVDIVAAVKRVLVIGSPGAGKSTFSIQLAAKTGLPLVHLDDVYWKPGWVRPAKAEWVHLVEQLTAADAWILDGNYTSTLKQRAALADEVIVLRYSRLLCLYRAVTRALFNRYCSRKSFKQRCETSPLPAA
ncbi:P-loop NTPase family protein [Deinococcus terrestris]|uniref:AAA family ATPase n=1 Tax=Deinococcus terrestris TaxID=2651870 RepID=UPI0018848AF3|nr:AAA family ATPase [Deinococcus terrestris]